jgi:Gram-negative bacterial TonB protein C-terminal
MSFQIESSTLTTFRARPLVSATIPRRNALRITPEARMPRFPVSGQREKTSWFSLLGTLFERVHLPMLREPVRLFKETPLLPFRVAGRSLSVSVVLHIGLILLIPLALSYVASQEISSYADAEVEQPRMIYYTLPKESPNEKLPKITPKGEGGQPGSGQLQALLQKLGSETDARKIVIVSKPVRPDNKRQTIYQPATPPDLKIDMDLKLPNVVGGPETAIAKPKVHVDAKDSRPMQARRNAEKALAPNLAAVNAAIPTNLAAPTVAQPHLAVPINESRPKQAQVQVGQANAPTLSETGVATATNLGEAYRAGEPKAPEAPAVASAESSNGSGKSTKDDAVQTAGDGKGVVVVSVDPADVAALAKLPAGNRWGDFTIAPNGGQPGAVNGSANGVANAGSHASGGGGDLVPGVGKGYAGGGGGNSGSNGSLSINGDPSGKGSELLDATIFREMVIPVPANAVLRRNALVVSSGPMGGGGLQVYGALHCGKIWTVFLPMPGQPWTLQYCQSGGGAPAQQARSNVVHMETGVVPPDVLARFDFKRQTVPFEKKGKPIVLKGVITDDGTVSEIKVYQGVLSGMDDAARVAFSKWKFKPALKDGKAVPVDVLVGVPTEIGGQVQ